MATTASIATETATDLRLGARSDESLLIDYQATGDHELFAELVHRYESELYAFLYRRCHDATLAEDAFQAAFVKVHRKCGQFDESRRFRPWLYAIAANAAVDAVRGSRRHQSVSLQTQLSPHLDGGDSLLDTMESADVLPSEQLLRDEREAECRTAIMNLPEKMKVVVEMIFFQGMKYREVAEALSIPIGTVKSRIHEALKRLRLDWHEAASGLYREPIAA